MHYTGYTKICGEETPGYTNIGWAKHRLYSLTVVGKHKLRNPNRWCRNIRLYSSTVYTYGCSWWKIVCILKVVIPARCPTTRSFSAMPPLTDTMHLPPPIHQAARVCYNPLIRTPLFFFLKEKKKSKNHEGTLRYPPLIAPHRDCFYFFLFFYFLRGSLITQTHPFVWPNRFKPGWVHEYILFITTHSTWVS
jgi:hypothetical protein